MKYYVSTCRVIRGEVTSDACLLKGHHGAGGLATVPAPLGEDTHTITQISKVSWVLYIQQLMPVFFCELPGTFTQIDWVPKPTHVCEMQRKCPCFLTWLDSLGSVLMPGRSCTDRRLWGSHVAVDKKDTQERCWKASNVSREGRCSPQFVLLWQADEASNKVSLLAHSITGVGGCGQHGCDMQNMHQTCRDRRPVFNV